MTHKKEIKQLNESLALVENKPPRMNIKFALLEFFLIGTAFLLIAGIAAFAIYQLSYTLNGISKWIP